WSVGVAALTICVSAMCFGVFKSADENMRSARGASAALAKAIPAGQSMLTWNVLWSQPELFYYAHLDPTVQRVSPTDDLPNGALLVLDGDEWAKWQSKPEYKAQLRQIAVIHPYKHVAHVCWYSK
ncbi:MAG TPA: hypothetical protein VG722_08575, partial [Tepidisphaeraceae bacterium]|nr:hypothetical protein [Tepidisphaeraceae bacterium]